MRPIRFTCHIPLPRFSGLSGLLGAWQGYQRSNRSKVRNKKDPNCNFVCVCVPWEICLGTGSTILPGEPQLPDPVLAAEPNLGCRRYFVPVHRLCLELRWQWWLVDNLPTVRSTRWICCSRSGILTWFSLGASQSSTFCIDTIHVQVVQETTWPFQQAMQATMSRSRAGAFLGLSQLQDVAWEATEGLNYDDMELSDDPFKPTWSSSTSCSSMKRRWSFLNDAKSSSRSSDENMAKNFKPTC